MTMRCAELERLIQLAGGRRPRRNWTLTDEAMDTLVCSIIHLCANEARNAGQTMAAQKVLDVKTRGIKFLKTDYSEVAA